jgi:hypothetical protein
MARSVRQKNANPAKPFASVHENIEAQKPHTKSLKRRRIFPSPSAQRLTKPLMISLRSRAREVVERRAYASTPPVCSSVLSACVSRLPPAVCVRPRGRGRIRLVAFPRFLLHLPWTTFHRRLIFHLFQNEWKHFKRMNNGWRPSVIPGYNTLLYLFTVVPSGYHTEKKFYKFNIGFFCQVKSWGEEGLPKITSRYPSASGGRCLLWECPCPRALPYT